MISLTKFLSLRILSAKCGQFCSIKCELWSVGLTQGLQRSFEMFMPFQRASQNLTLKDESIIFILGFSGLHEDYISHRLKSFS